MDTVYGTKKYYHNVLENECSRSVSNRAITNYPSYQNTIGAASNPYSHMNKFICPTDMSIQSQYGYYNSPRNMWKDTRNLTPSSYSSSKKRKSLKSFTVLLMTAAFIVMIAVISIAALAFYFSTYKAPINDSIMVFDGKMEITRGDVYTAGLKYNHTSAYQQKAELYENLIEKALKSNGLEVSKSEVSGFGNGPLLNVQFRIYLDMRTVPINIKNVEQHIKESLLNEIADQKSEFKNIRIEAKSIVVKRLLDNELIQSASFVIEQTTLPSLVFEDVPNTRPVPTKVVISKLSSRPSVEPKPDIIKGSFQVTKTDADITQRKTLPAGTSTLRPFTVTNGSIKVKTKKITIEKVKPLPRYPEIVTTTGPGDTTTKVKPEIVTEYVPQTTMSTTTKSTTTTSASTTTKLPSTTTQTILPKTSSRTTSTYVSVDTGHWRPMNPTKNQASSTSEPITSVKYDLKIIENNHSVWPTSGIRNKTTVTPGFEPVFYQSYSNSGFRIDTNRFEQLGNGYVKPYPLPVNKLTDELLPDDLAVTKMTMTADEKNRIDETKEPDGTNYEEIILTEPPNRENETLDKDSVGSVLLDVLVNPDLADSDNAGNFSQLNYTKFEDVYEKSNTQSVKDNIYAEDEDDDNGDTNEMLSPSSSSSATQKLSQSWTEPSLFPINSKFDTENRTFHSSNSVRKIFNETLHAWIIESAPKEPMFRADFDLTTKKNNTGPIKNISTIFDTLSSKLGVYPSISTKLPPFSNFMPNKAIDNSSQFNLHQLNKRINDHIMSSRKPLITSKKPMVSEDDVNPTKVGAIVGEAEIEEVDPTQYEDMLISDKISISRSSTVPTLVTLLPVKSNSGIRPLPNKGLYFESQRL